MTQMIDSRPGGPGAAVAGPSDCDRDRHGDCQAELISVFRVCHGPQAQPECRQ
jgi:hypothetical protein